ncbi:MAG: SPOR domain-containing protein, partial [Saprospiraceae bacterium]
MILPMLHKVLVLLCWLVATSASVAFAQDFRVQVAAYADSIPVAYFKDQGLERVVVSTDQMGLYRYYAGSYKTREQAEKMLEEVIAKGFPNAIIIDLEEQRALCGANCSYNRPGQPKFLQTGKKSTTLRYIFFDTGRFTLSPEAFSQLDLVAAALLAKPQLLLKIIGQTDNVG